MRPADWPEVQHIYQQGMATGVATFETAAPSWASWNEKHFTSCRLTAVNENHLVAGWAALAPVSRRPVYEGVAEVSIYVLPAESGQGIGSRLLDILIRESERAGFWTLQSSIFPENTASIQLHKKHGFREFGRRERIAKRDGRWYDLVLMERRSSITGTEET